MIRPSSFLALLAFTILLPATAPTQITGQPETVEVRNGTIVLHALLWRPQGAGPFPAILFNHGSGRSKKELERLGPYEQQAGVLGPVFARHGYIFLYLFRRGVGLSANQGPNAVELMNREFGARGQDARNSIQLRLLENEEMTDALAGLAYLRNLVGVETRNISAIGHSFGGSLTFLMAEREPALRAVVIFSGAGYSWDRSPPLRVRLFAAAARITVPAFFIQAENDFALSAGKGLDARLQQLGKPHRLKIYPPVGHTAEDGHAFLYLAVPVWEPDVFAFLDENKAQ